MTHKGTPPQVSYKLGPTSRKDRIAARFLSQVHAVLSNAALTAPEEGEVPQEQAARDLEVDQATISWILSGTGNPTARTIGELAGALGYRPELVLHKVEPSER
jgi:transcriptional regulator with XRE-family HTH domain